MVYEWFLLRRKYVIQKYSNFKFFGKFSEVDQLHQALSKPFYTAFFGFLTNFEHYFCGLYKPTNQKIRNS